MSEGYDISAVVRIFSNSLNVKVMTHGQDHDIVDLSSIVSVPRMINTSHPVLIWENSTDPDNDSITYQLQYDQTRDFLSPVVIDNISPGNSQTSYTITGDLEENTPYYWRVRAYDGEEYSDWSNTGHFIYSTTSVIYRDLYGQAFVVPRSEISGKIEVFSERHDGTKDLSVLVSIPVNKNIPAKVDVCRLLTASVNINHCSNLSSKVVVYHPADLPGRIKIVVYKVSNIMAQVRLYKNVDLNGNIYIIPRSEINGRLYVIHGIKARVNIFPHTEFTGSVNVDISEQLIKATVKVVKSGSLGLSGRVTVWKGFSEILGRINVFRTRIDLPAQVIIPRRENISVQVYVLPPYEYKDLSAIVSLNKNSSLLPVSVNIKRSGNSDILSKFTAIANVPSGVINLGAYEIPSSYDSSWYNEDGSMKPGDGAIYIPEAEYQQRTSILFIWQQPSTWGDFASVGSYSVAWNDSESYNVSDSDQYVADNHIVKSVNDSGVYFFRIRAKNSFGHFGEQGDYTIKINQSPTTPTELSSLPSSDGLNVYTDMPEPTWKNSADADQTDVLTYDFEMYNSSDLLVISKTGLQSGSSTTTTYVCDRLPAGEYYWRVRSFDGKQHSDWAEYKNLNVCPLLSNIGGRIKIVSPGFNDVKARVRIIDYEDLGGFLFVPAKSLLMAKIFIVNASDINARVDIIKKGELSLGALVNTYNVGLIPGRAIVDVSLQEMKARVNVKRYAGSYLSSSVDVKGNLRARVTVTRSGSSNLFSSLKVCRKIENDIVGQCFVAGRDEIKSRISIFKNIDFKGKTTVLEDIPGTPVVTSSIELETWQTETEVYFYWDTPYDEFSTIKEYYIAFNELPTYVLTESNQRTNDNWIKKTIFDTGKWYFHIVAVNNFGHWSSQSRVCVYFNHVPTTVNAPLYVDGVEIISTPHIKPILSWGNASDEDQTDTLVYNIQLSDDEEFSNIINDVDGISQSDTMIRTSYQIGEYDSYKIPSIGRYYWRVRACDGKQYGQFTSGGVINIVPETSNVGGMVYIVARKTSNIQAKVYIVPNIELSACITISKEVVSNLGGRVKVCYKRDSEINGKVRLFKNEDIKAQIIIRPYSDLLARARVIDVYGCQDLFAKVNSCKKRDSEISAKVNVCEKNTSSFGGIIFIEAISNLSAAVTPYSLEHYGNIEQFGTNIKVRVNIFKDMYVSLPAKLVAIANRPGVCLITANIPEGEWQEESNIVFKWTDASREFIVIEGYYTQLDKSPLTQVNDSFQRTENFTRSYDLEDISGAGEYYFHVAAKGNDLFGETAHFKLRYNHKPSTPSSPMLVNNKESLYTPVVIAKKGSVKLSWTASTDYDIYDVIVYHVQISKSSNFSSDIIMSSENVLGSEYNIGNYSFDSGNYYWRVRAYDGHEYSEWSEIGKITINTPPTIPSSLMVY